MNTHIAPPAPPVVRSALRTLLDPEIGLNVVDLGMIGAVGVAPDGGVTVEVMPTTPGCPMHEALAQGVQRVVGALAGVTSVEVRFVFDPPWTPDRISRKHEACSGLPEQRTPAFSFRASAGGFARRPIRKPLASAR